MNVIGKHVYGSYQMHNSDHGTAGAGISIPVAPFFKYFYEQRYFTENTLHYIFNRQGKIVNSKLFLRIVM